MEKWVFDTVSVFFPSKCFKLNYIIDNTQLQKHAKIHSKLFFFNQRKCSTIALKMNLRGKLRAFTFHSTSLKQY